MNARHRVGFIGAGHISRFHASALRHVDGAELAGIYDVDAARCTQAAQELGTRAMASLQELREAGVDVVHVLTPPETHARLTLEALEWGAHVIVEKPFATDAEDCRRIAAAARERGLRVCVDHSLLFDPQVHRALEAVRSGKLGRVVSVHVLRSAEYPPYEGGRLPPHYRSAGFPFRDLGVHQLYLLQAFLGPIEDVRAQWESFGGDPNLRFDEWRADVRCRDGFGHFEISFNVRPIQNLIVIAGTKGVLRVDTMTQFSTRRTALPLPKAAERVINAYAEALAPLVDVPRSIAGFVRKKIRQYHGVQALVAEFYRTLDAGEPVPVSVEDATAVVEWVERVAREADADPRARQAPAEQRHDAPILITGAVGALGSAVLARLLAQGQHCRIFVRRTATGIPDGVDVVTGDLGDPEAVDAAVRGARIVVHLGAATKGGWISQRTSTVVGTQNVIEACMRHGVEQLVYVSSMSVVDWAGAPAGAPIDEGSPLEPNAEARGAYTQAKLQAELLVRDAVVKRRLPAVILRPGQIFGGKLPLVNAAVARKIGKLHLVLGDGRLRLPLVYIDDVVDAVISAIDRRLVDGEIVQLVDTELPTQNEILRSAFGTSKRIVRVPRPMVFGLGWLSEVALRPLKRRSPLSRYRLHAALARRTYRSLNAGLLHWAPRVGVAAGIRTVTGAPQEPQR